MDLVEEILELTNTLSTKKIQQLLGKIADRVPHAFLPRPGEIRSMRELISQLIILNSA